jgi:hypothetical protein
VVGPSGEAGSGAVEEELSCARRHQHNGFFPSEEACLRESTPSGPLVFSSEVILVVITQPNLVKAP